MDFQSAMETFAEAWVAANTQTPLTEAAGVQALVMSRPNETAGAGAAAATTVSNDGCNNAADKDSVEPDGEMNRNVAQLNRLPSHTESNNVKSLPRPSGNTAKSIPVHCVVEQMTISRANDCERSIDDGSSSSVEMDSYAIVPSQSLFAELVRTALFKLGYSSSDVFGAKGALQIRNWKPLSFETITDDGNATVGEILGELTTVATLRIRLYSRPKVSTANDVKEKLLQLLLTQSHSLLVEAGCPIDETLLTLISKGGNLCEIPEDTRHRFDKWYVQQVLQHRRLSPTGRQTPGDPSPMISVVSASTSVNHQQQHHHHNINGSDHSLANQLSTAISASISQRTRMRTSFDPELELPKLHRWFNESQHPTRLQIQQYVRELNGLESRKGRKPLDVNNVVYWFKNARAAFKRAEQRHMNGSHSPSHDSTSNDNPGRDTSPEEIDSDVVRCRKSVGDPHQTADVRPSVVGGSGPPAQLSTAANSGKTFGVGSGVGCGEDGINGNGSSHEAMDLSTTHRDVEQPNGHWKSSSSASGNLKEEREDDDDEDEVETDHMTSVKQEPADGSSNSVADTDEDEEEDGEEEEDDEMEEEVDFVESSGVLSQSSLQGHQSDEGANEMSEVGPNRKVIPAFHYMNSSHPGQQTLHLQTSSSSSVSPLTSHPLRGGALHQPHYHHHHHSHTPTSMLYMAGFIPSAMAAALDERRKRNRTFIDPVTEVPRLEQWFTFNTHPPHSLILKYTDELNQMPYRQKFPKLEPKNVQFWFKNRRAKCKRLRLSVNLVTSPTTTTAAAASW